MADLWARRGLLGRGLAGLGLLGAWGWRRAWAQKGPTGPVVLTVRGRLTQANQTGAFVADMAMLAALPVRRSTLHTPWDPKPMTFEGPLLRDVLRLAGASGQTLSLVAVNDYQVQAPFSDVTEFDVLLALKMNGQPIPPRTKGPLFVVYPFDGATPQQMEAFRNRSIWQLTSIQVD